MLPVWRRLDKATTISPVGSGVDCGCGRPTLVGMQAPDALSSTAPSQRANQPAPREAVVRRGLGIGGLLARGRRLPNRRRLGLGVSILAWGAAIVLAAGCTYDDGRTLRDPASDATLPPFRTELPTPTSPPTAPPATPITVETPAWEADDLIPDDHTCAGDGDRPTISWTSSGQGVETVVMVSDANGDRQMIVAGIDPSITELPANAIEIGTLVLGDLDAGDWIAPCPPDGQSRDYYLSVYELSSESGLEPDVDAVTAQAAVDERTVARGVLRAVAVG